ncbi:hypothetical protein ANME2D_02124 [Candidatus Methanoperedens nitroreducens]|uniref:Uncharacterized protein n=1 Tax=Candidatus Methanoperedens nitratireducens TaxID=1392998 RepID=A0A062UWM6_9EURY|nr:hypothetical protein ANME2D_02124 [Candidatus Methanoperedens nitroreducens]
MPGGASGFLEAGPISINAKDAKISATLRVLRG